MAVLDTITTMEDYVACVVNTRAVNPKGYEDFVFKIKAPQKYPHNYIIGMEDRDLKKNAKNDYSKQGMGYVMSGYKEPELGLRFNNGNTKYKPMRIETPVDGTPIQPKIRPVGAKRRLKLNKKK